MAQYVRAESDSFRKWATDLGLPALGLGLGLTMTGYTNFWIGILVAGLAEAALIDNVLRRKSSTAKYLGSLIAAGGICLIMWLIFRPMPLEIFATQPTNYQADAEIYGLKWKAGNFGIDVRIDNDTEHEYQDFDTYLRTNLSISAIGIKGYVNQCIAIPALPGIKTMGATITPQGGASIAILRGDQPTTATFYRIRCDKIARKSNIDLIVAVPTPNAEQIKWIVFFSRFISENRTYTPYSSQCLVKTCGSDIPKFYQGPRE